MESIWDVRTTGRISDDIKIERTGDKLVKGTDCFERNVLPSKAMRKSLVECVETDFSKASVKAAISEIGSNEENPRCVAIKGLLKKIARRSKVDDCYKDLFSELAKDSPISIWKVLLH